MVHTHRAQVKQDFVCNSVWGWKSYAAPRDLVFPMKWTCKKIVTLRVLRLTDIANDFSSYSTSIEAELASKLPNATDISLQLPDNSVNETI